MNTNIPDISKQIYAEDTAEVMDSMYGVLGPHWTAHQLEWITDIYQSFKDHDKYLIVIFLIKKTLDFYSRNFTKLTFEEFYSKNIIAIEKFSISEIVQGTDIPKETVRRKIAELEKKEIIFNSKKKTFINRGAYPFVKPINSIKRISRFLSIFSKILKDKKVLLRDLSSNELEIIIKKNFSYVWKIYYEFQIPMLLNFKKVFGDLESFHIWGTCIINQHYLYSKKADADKKSRDEFIINAFADKKMLGLSAMSISDITGIPRATVVRKLKNLVLQKNLKINEKKHYILTGNILTKAMPIQKAILDKVSSFSTKIYNLAIL